MNSPHKNIQFTVELEQEERLPFLDILIIETPGWDIRKMVYRKQLAPLPPSEKTFTAIKIDIEHIALQMRSI